MDGKGTDSSLKKRDNGRGAIKYYFAHYSVFLLHFVICYTVLPDTLVIVTVDVSLLVSVSSQEEAL